MGTSIFDILSLRSIHEADGEEQSSPQQNDDDLGNIDDDFDIDTSLDDVGSEKSQDDNNSENNTGDSSESSSDVPADRGDSSGMDAPAGAGDTSGRSDMGEEEPVPSNTDIFSSLTAEEQKIKIRELKNLFSNLYSSCDEILGRIDKLDINEENLDTLSRISSTMYDMKIYISDYLSNVFPNKSYIENDVVFVRFLTIIKSITEILDDIGKKFKREQEKDPDYSKNE